jgi:histidine triad (HIT) family protein
MYNHASENYICPICLTIKGIENEQNMAKQADVVYRDEYVLAFINSKFIRNNPGHVIVVPVTHFENIYDLPKEYLHRIIEVSQKIALAFKVVRKCDGVWVEQNNEPASGQHAFHYHMHIVPRFENDNLKKQLAEEGTYLADPADRVPYADALKLYLSSQ